MSQESTTPDRAGAIREAAQALNRRDFASAMTLYAPHAAWDTSAIGLGVHEGRDAVRAFHEDWVRAYEDFSLIATDVLDLGNGVVLTVFDQRGSPKGSTAFVELRFALLTTWANGLIDHGGAYTDIDEARAAAERLAKERAE